MWDWTCARQKGYSSLSGLPIQDPLGFSYHSFPLLLLQGQNFLLSRSNAVSFAEDKAASAFFGTAGLIPVILLWYCCRNLRFGLRSKPWNAMRLVTGDTCGAGNILTWFQLFECWNSLNSSSSGMTFPAHFGSNGALNTIFRNTHMCFLALKLCRISSMAFFTCYSKKSVCGYWPHSIRCWPWLIKFILMANDRAWNPAFKTALSRISTNCLCVPN